MGHSEARADVMREIPLVRNRGSAIVNDDDAILVRDRPWYWATGGYAKTARLGSDPPEWPKMIFMHRLIMGLVLLDDRHIDIDHINGDGLDNRRDNLRVIPHRLNCANRRSTQLGNSHGFLGVYYNRQGGRWVSEVKISGRKYRVGSFDNPEGAARARWTWIKEHNLQDFYSNHGMIG
jgi:hypothetical protein